MAHSASLAQMHDQMDNLLAIYLQSLDNYTRAQARLQKHMSAGFLHLARANFNARDGVTRYGKDFYHERAMAAKRVKLQPDESRDGGIEITFARWEASVNDGGINASSPNANPTSDEQTKRSGSKAEPEKTQQTSPLATPESDASNAQMSSNKESSAGDVQVAKNKPPLETDPLRWFGILVPRDLRAAQSSFELAVNNPISDALGAARSMRETEVEIRRLRKDIRRGERV